MAKKGIPSKYSPQIADEICRRLAAGESLNSICRDEKMPDERTVRRWKDNDPKDFGPKYARARDDQCDTLAEQVIDIAKQCPPAADFIAKARLEIDAIKWFAGKTAPKKYGDKQQIDMNVTGDLAQKLEEARKRTNVSQD